MVTRDEFWAIVHHESLDIAPWTMAFFDERVAKELLGIDGIPSDFLPGSEFSFGASSHADWEIKAAYAERAGIPAVPVGRGAGLAFGHGGPGEFAERLIEVDAERRVSVYETGVRKEVSYSPHFYRHSGFPLDSLDQISELVLPDARSEGRFRGLHDEVVHHKERNRVTFANVNGFFSAIHYYLYPYDRLLMDLILQPKRVRELVEQVATFNLSAAEQLLAAGVDVICLCDDMGTEESMLFSPEIYRTLFKTWHERLAQMCHDFGAVMHMHSHGNISKIVPDLVEIGVDILNPLDPDEGMHLSRISEEFRGKIALCGGMDKHFFDWGSDDQWDYLERLDESIDQGFFLMDSGGIPENITASAWRKFVTMREELRCRRRTR